MVCNDFKDFLIKGKQLFLAKLDYLSVHVPVSSEMCL